MDTLSKVHKAVAVIQFKLEGQLIARHPEYRMDHRRLLDKIDYRERTVTIDGGVYPLNDCDFPTVDPADPYVLTGAEAELVASLRLSFRRSERLQRHVRFLYSNGSLYKCCNQNLLFHGCIPMEEDGIDTQKLEEALNTEKNVKYLYTIPNFQNPSGITMSLEKRKKVYELCRDHNVIVLEDNPYGDLRFAGTDVPSIKSLDTEHRVIYTGSFSKILAPGLRVGYVSAPKEIISKITVCKQVSDVHTNIWAQAVCAAFLERTDMDTYLDGLRAVYRRKCNLMADGIRSHFSGKVKWEMPQGGLFLWCTLPDDCDMPAFCTKAVKDYSIAVVPGNAFLVDETAPTSSFRLNYSTPSDELIVKGIEILGKMTKEILGA